MLNTILEQLHQKRLVLASSSPRRKEILSKNAFLKFEVIPSEFAEDLDKKALAPPQFVLQTAIKKGEEVIERLGKDASTIDALISADTVVSFEGEILGKPEDPADAVRMLLRLSGREHSVFTGVSIDFPSSGAESVRFVEETKVEFDVLTEQGVKAYVATKEPLDKAGAYGIQAQGGCIVKRINGDYFNVVGFPLNAFCRHLYAARASLGISD